jgi:hypothetical protein
MSYYKADNPAGCELSIGRWSQRLAPLVLHFTDVKAVSSGIEVCYGSYDQ